MSQLEPPRLSAKKRQFIASSVLVLISLIALLVGTKYVFTSYVTARGLAEIRQQDYVAAENSFRMNLYANWYERWRSPYNVGVALYHQRSWVRSQEQFQAALEYAPEDKKCLVALNLAWSYEAYGDDLARRSDLVKASVAWRQAETVAKEAECSDGDDENNEDEDSESSASDEESMEDQQAETQARNNEKAQEAEEATAGQADDKDGESPSQEQKISDLNQVNQQAQKQRQGGGGSNQPGEGAGDGGSQGRPTW